MATTDQAVRETSLADALQEAARMRAIPQDLADRFRELDRRGQRAYAEEFAALTIQSLCRDLNGYMGMLRGAGELLAS